MPSSRPAEPTDQTGQTDRVDLGRRRRRARSRAVGAFLVGVLTMAITSAMLLFVVVFVIARAWTWIRRRDIAQFFLWDLAPGAAVVVALFGVLAAAALVFRFFWTATVERVLRDLEAVAVADDPSLRDRAGRVVHLVEELSIGRGVAPDEFAEVWVTDDPTPNSLSMRSSSRRVLVVTSAVLDLPRHEQEAMVAHEMAHLWSPDAHWVTSGLVALGTARRVGMEVCAGGVILVMVSGYLVTKGAFLWGTFVAGVGLFVTGGIAAFTFGRLERGVRRDSDELADVAAVQLTKDPLSLGKLCLRLAEHEGQVGPAPTSAEHLWFELVQAPNADGSLDPTAVARSRDDLVRRAARAHAEARAPFPGVATGTGSPSADRASAAPPAARSRPETDRSRAARSTRQARRIRKERAARRSAANDPPRRRGPLP